MKKRNICHKGKRKMETNSNITAKMDELVSEAIWICKEYDRVGVPLFQRKMSLDYHTAEKVFQELEKIELISNAEDEFDGEDSVRIGNINKEKLAELLKN